MANFGPIWSKLGRSIADVVVVAVVWLAAVGALFWRSMVLFWTIQLMSVTDDGESKGLSIGGSDVRRTPRLVVGAALIQEVGVCADGKGGNSSSGSGGRRGTPRLFMLLFLFLARERS